MEDGQRQGRVIRGALAEAQGLELGERTLLCSQKHKVYEDIQRKHG